MMYGMLLIPFYLAQTQAAPSIGVHFDVATLATIAVVIVNAVGGIFLRNVKKRMDEMASKEYVDSKISNELLKSREDIVELKGKVNSIDSSLHDISTSLRELNSALLSISQNFMRREDCKYFHDIPRKE